MVDQRFEHSHNADSIFSQMDLLLLDKEALKDEFSLQSKFMEEIFWAIRGETEPTKMLVQAKFFTIQTLN